ncbi:MAG: hypothetical protein J0H18_04105 [Rhizobiales bacterium]|nr:hypothetical protein [Hyphomicrobiales bacterium]OJY06084.1 MAG: hypothetical protein BGP07_00260 [Rhizobiales bacterium 63-22]
MGRKPFPSFRISLALAMPLLAGLAGCAGDVSPLQRAGIAGPDMIVSGAITPAAPVTNAAPAAAASVPATPQQPRIVSLAEDEETHAASRAQ